MAQERAGQQRKVPARPNNTARRATRMLDPAVIVLAQNPQDVAGPMDRPLFVTLLGDAEPRREIRKHDQALCDCTQLYGRGRQPAHHRRHIRVDRGPTVPHVVPKIHGHRPTLPVVPTRVSHSGSYAPLSPPHRRRLLRHTNTTTPPHTAANGPARSARSRSPLTMPSSARSSPLTISRTPTPIPRRFVARAIGTLCPLRPVGCVTPAVKGHPVLQIRSHGTDRRDTSGRTPGMSTSGPRDVWRDNMRVAAVIAAGDTQPRREPVPAGESLACSMARTVGRPGGSGFRPSAMKQPVGAREGGLGVHYESLS